MKSWQTDHGIFSGTVNDFDFVPYEAVTVPIPSDRLPESRAWQWQSIHVPNMPKWGREGRWVGVEDNRGRSLFLADNSLYLLGTTIGGTAYTGFGPKPVWLAYESAPTAHHVLTNGVWIIPESATALMLVEAKVAAVHQIENAYSAALYAYNHKAVERQIKSDEAVAFVKTGKAPLIESYAKAKGIALEVAVAEVTVRASASADLIAEVSRLKNLKYGVEALDTIEKVQTYSLNAVGRINEIAKQLG